MNTVLYEQAKSLHQAGDLERAAVLYRRARDADPADFRASHNLGVVMEALGDAAGAAEDYRRALAANPGAAWSHYNLARLDHLAGRAEAAEAGYRAALAIEPSLAEAHFNLGRLLLERGDAVTAEAALRASLRLAPDAPGTESYLGDALFAQRRVREALDAYRRTAGLDPADSAAQFDVAKTLEFLHRHDEAIECYRRSIVLQPGSVAAREGLARALNAAGRRAEAIASVREWLSIEPGHPVAMHLLAALGADAAPPRASDAYVRQSFDRFAADFDATLARLDYRAPQLVAGALELECGAARGDLDILDAGCGTGLVAPLIRPWAKRLAGVDLSAAMLARARRRGGYDALHEAELTAFLGEFVASWDVIVCADTLCYFGDLGPVLAAAAQALREDGVLIFTLERMEGGDSAQPPAADAPASHAPFLLHPHGRFAHDEHHVRARLAALGLRAVLMRVVLRAEGGEGVQGLLCVARHTRSAISPAGPGSGPGAV